MRQAIAALLLSAASLTLAQTGTPKRPAITGIAFVRVYSSDPAATAKFYGETLGYSKPTSYRVHTKGDITHYGVGMQQWIETAPLPSPAPPSRLAAVGFFTSDARALEAYLKAHGVTTVEPLKDYGFSVRDPEGNLIIFVQRSMKGGGPTPQGVSHRIIHTGFLVRDADKENTFYRELLGFRPYWHGGRNDTTTDWVSQQVPDGTDWLEYMLNASPTPTPKQLGVMDHMSLGVAHMPDAIAALQKNGCGGPDCTASKVGRDGKTQLNLYDPDLTRVELMEFEPVAKPCCSEFTAKHPTEIESH